MPTLTPGTRIGQYEIVSLLGMGGMGEVYRARDAKLNREVALKTLPAAVGANADRLARFKREAQLLASLNHPNIGAIYGFEDSSGTHALVLELIEGPTLAETLDDGARKSGARQSGMLSVPSALGIARQIADALEAAHERGIIHRDLKPGNISIRPDGTVKVLDFGLAKAIDPAGGSGVASNVTGLATSGDVSHAGLILGTAAYMSPEQARGEPVDARTDIWAFGCVLYEMLSGQRAFPGQTATDAMAAVLTREPDWEVLPATTPESVRRVIRRCLTKDAKQRLRHISDARLDINDATGSSTQIAVPPRARTRSRLAVAALAGLAAAAAAGLGWTLASHASPTRPSGVTRVLVAPVEALSDDAESPVTISPDGRQLAYITGRGVARRIYVRRLDQYDSKAIPETDGADFPAFSPDGQWLAFVADRKLKKVDLTAGTTLVLCEVTESSGLSWRQPGTIIFGAGRSRGIHSVSASGGTPTELTKLEPTETYHRHPDTRPDGSVLLFTDIAGNGGQRIFAQSLKTGERRRIASGAGARFLPTGHVAYVSGTTLYAVPFDANRLEVTGDPVALFDRIAQSPLDAPQISFSDAGTVVYVPSAGPTRDALVWVDRKGDETPAGLPTEPIHFPRISPNGRRVSVIVGDTTSNAGDLRLYDFTRETWNRITVDGNVTFAIWSPDGAGLTQGSMSDSRYRIDTRTLDGGLRESLLADSPTSYPLSWSSDGRHLAIVMIGATTGQDIHVIDRESPGKPSLFLASKFREGAPTFSPDGKWIAYVSEKSGRSEIYMRPFPGPGEEWTLSTDGGNEPRWASNAPLLFYRQGDAMMVIDVTTAPTVSAGRPRRVFERPYQRTGGFWPNYDVTSDGQQFLMIKRLDRRPAIHINVLLNWLDELEQQVSVKP